MDDVSTGVLPKNIYFYWGAEKLSFLRAMSMLSFKKLNPDWRVVLVKSEREGRGFRNDADYGGKDYFPLLKNVLQIESLEEEYPEVAILDVSEVHKNDILKWCILSTRGGIASDTDILFFRPIDYESIKDTDIGLVSFEGNPKGGYIPVSFVLGQPNEFFKNLYGRAKEEVGDGYECVGTDLIEKLYGDFKNIERKFGGLRVRRLPSHIVFPFSETDTIWVDYFPLMFERTVGLPVDSIGVHWYAGTPFSRAYNFAINDENHGTFDNTICRIVGEVSGKGVNL